jgi:hypothetical protein
MNEPQRLPEALSFASAIAEFRYVVRAKEPILAPLFEQMKEAGARYRPDRDAIREWSESKMLSELATPTGRRRLQEHKANQAIYEDAGASIVLLLVPELERLYKKIDESLYGRGRDSYMPGIKFSRALSLLANQYKHLGEWRKEPQKQHDGLRDVAKLVDNGFRADAASEFFLRCGFVDYGSVQEAVLSCSEGLVDVPLAIDDDSELPTVRLQYPTPRPQQ